MKTSKLSYRKWFTIEELKNLLSSKTGLNFTAKQVLEKFKHDIYFHVKFDWEIDEYLIINGKQHKNTCILFKKNPNPFLANEAEIRAIYEIKQEAEFISESKETYLLLIKNKQQELIEEYGEIAIYNFKGYLNVPNIAIISDNLALTDENHLALPEYYHYDTNELLPSLHIENVSFIPNFIYLTFKSGSNFIHLSDLRIDADSVYDFLSKLDNTNTSLKNTEDDKIDKKGGRRKHNLRKEAIEIAKATYDAYEGDITRKTLAEELASYLINKHRNAIQQKKFSAISEETIKNYLKQNQIGNRKGKSKNLTFTDTTKQR